MSEDVIKTEEDSRELFHGWQTEPVISKVAEFLRNRGYTSKQGTYSVDCNSQEYRIMSTFMADMLNNLPFGDKVGETKLMRKDAKKVVEEISAVLRGKKSWNEIEWVFGEDLEVFKNLVYHDHNLTSAICYSVDLGLNLADQAYNFVVLDRFSVTPDPKGTVRVKRDGSFVANRASVIISTNSGNVDN